MKTELPCAIVRDLLPSYVEGLTEEETTAAVKEHLNICESCRSRCEAMSSGEAALAASTKEVDYLKQVKKKNHLKILIAVVLAVVLVLTGVGAKLFVIGSPCNPENLWVTASVSESGESMKISVTATDSAFAIPSLEPIMEQTDDGLVARISAKRVLASPLYHSGTSYAILHSDILTRVEVCGETVWQNGIAINGYIRRLMKHKTPYVGNASAVNQLISDLDLDVPHTLELQTSSEPYSITIHFTGNFREDRYFMAESHAYLILALVGNLDTVQWDQPDGWTGSLSLSEANEALPDLIEEYNQSHDTNYPILGSVKDYAQDSYHIQVLYNVLVGSHFE